MFDNQDNNFADFIVPDTHDVSSLTVSWAEANSYADVEATDEDLQNIGIEDNE